MIRVDLWRLAPGVLALGMLGTMPGCTESERTTQAASSPAPAVITTAEVATRPMVRTVDVVGSLSGWERVTVGSKRGGRVLKVLHEMGDRVRPGDPLVELDPVDARLAIQQAESNYLAELVKLGTSRDEAESFYLKFGVSQSLVNSDEVMRLILRIPSIKQAHAQLEKANRDLDRNRQLLARNSISIQELQDQEESREVAQAAYDAAVLTARTVVATALSNRVALAQAQQGLDDLTVRVPHPTTLPAGMTLTDYAVTRRQLAEGQMLREGDPVAELVIDDPLRLLGNVPERFSSDVQVGASVQVRVPSQESPFEGKVTRVSPAVDSTNRTFQVEILVPNPEKHLLPGGFARAAIVVHQNAQALVVPRDAVAKFAGVTKVFVVQPGQAATVQAVPVTVGVEQTDAVEVVGSLRPGDQVAVSNLDKLADGTRIEVRPPAPDPSGSNSQTESVPAPTTTLNHHQG
jgi:RND family efflux transporter MFP subunit